MKPWHEKPLWEKCYLSVHKAVYMHAGRIIGHKGVNAFAFYDEAKKLPCYDKLRFENAVRDLTEYAARERGDYQLHAHAKKVLRIIIGPAPNDPEYRTWWVGRMISVQLARQEGKEPEFAYEPPVPLPEDPQETPKAAKKPAKKKAKG